MKAIYFLLCLSSLFARFRKATTCDPQWNSYDDKFCIKCVPDEKVNHSEIAEKCAMLDGRSLSDITPRLLTYVVDLSEKYGDVSFWLGPNAGKKHSLFEEQPLRTASSPHSDADDDHTYCYYVQNKDIHIGNCNEPKGFICEKDYRIPHKNITLCPQDAEARGSSCLWEEHQELLEHSEAMDACASKGGHLANLNNKLKELYAKEVINLKNASFWIGATRQGGTFRWTNGEIVENLYTTTHCNGEGCCMMLTSDYESSSEVLWLVENCSIPAYAVCEKELASLSLLTATKSPNLPSTASAVSTKIPELQCPHGNSWIAHDHHGVCFWKTTYETRRFSWNNARQFCQSYGGDLASYKDKFEEIAGLWEEKEQSLWIGLHRERGSNVFQWSDGSPVSYSNWATGQPNVNSSNELCVAHTGNESKWEVRYCGVLLWFICKAPKTIDPPILEIPKVKPETACNNSLSSSLLSWWHHEGKCYSVSAFRHYSWKSADLFCQDNGALLTSIHSFEETNFILQLISTSSERPLWIGLRAIGLHSSFEWEDGSPLGFVNWNENEQKVENYVDTCVTFDAQNGMWSKNHCDRLASVVCTMTDGSENAPKSTISISPGFCPDGWYTFDYMCYGVFGRQMSERQKWSNAYQKCFEMGASMVSIHSQREQDFLSTIVGEFEASAWIGMNASISGILFLWADNSNMDFTYWDVNEPNSYNSEEECVEMTYKPGVTGKWNDAKCGSLKPFFCQLPKDPTMVKAGLDPTLCLEPKGWRKWGSSCFKVHDDPQDKTSWLQAQTRCRSYGGNLASVKSYAVHSLLKNLLEDLKGPFWIGMREKMRNTYAWLGEYPVYYTNWLSDQPREVSEIDNCVVVNSEDQWMIKNCNEQHSFICEVDKVGIPTIGPSNHDAVCPNTSVQWKDLGGDFCYIIQLIQKRTWDEAMHTCFKDGGHLASFHSGHALDVISHYLKNTGKPLHIGLGRKQNGNFGWVDGSPVDFTKWAWGEPNNPSEHCVEMHTDVMTWNGISCKEQRGYICSARKIQNPNNHQSSSKTEEKKAEYVRRSVAAGGIIGIIVCVLVIMAIMAVSFYYCCPTSKIRRIRLSEQLH